MLIDRLKKRIAARLAGHERIVLWGGGSSGRFARDLLPGRLNYVVDSFSEDEDLDGLEIRRPESLKTEPTSTAVVIASVAEREIKAWCEDAGVASTPIGLRTLFLDATKPASELSKLSIDLVAYYQDGWFNSFVRQPQLLVNITFRICAALHAQRTWIARLLLFPMRLIHAFAGGFFGIDIPITVSAGAGLGFAHFGSIVIHDDARIGNFCRFYQGVTIGSDKTGCVPKLGDFVTVWANAVVIGDCQLGDHTQVGAAALCLGPLAVEDATLVGAPARPVRRDAQVEAIVRSVG